MNTTSKIILSLMNMIKSAGINSNINVSQQWQVVMGTRYGSAAGPKFKRRNDFQSSKVEGPSKIIMDHGSGMQLRSCSFLGVLRARKVFLTIFLRARKIFHKIIYYWQNFRKSKWNLKTRKRKEKKNDISPQEPEAKCSHRSE